MPIYAMKDAKKPAYYLATLENIDTSHPFMALHWATHFFFAEFMNNKANHSLFPYKLMEALEYI